MLAMLKMVFDVSQWGMDTVFAQVVSGLEAFDAAGDQAKGEDTFSEAYLAEQSAEEAAAKKKLEEEKLAEKASAEALGEGPTPEEPPAFSITAPESWSSLKELLGGWTASGMEDLQASVAAQSQTFADSILSLATNGPYNIGYGLGWAGGFAAVQAALFFGTAAVGEALNLGRLAVQGVIGAARMGTTALRGGLKAGTALLAKVGSLMKGQLARVGSWLLKLWDDLVLKINQLLGRRVATELAEKAAKEAAEKAAKEAAEKAAKNTAKSGAKGAVGKAGAKAAKKGKKARNKKADAKLEKTMKSDAKKQATKAWKAFADNSKMMKVKPADTFLDKNMERTKGKDKAGNKWALAATPLISGGAWTVDVEAKGSGKDLHASVGKGWAAKDTAGNAFLAPTNESTLNEGFIGGLAEDLDKAWQSFGKDGKTTDTVALLEAFDTKKKAFKPKYKEMKLSLEGAKATQKAGKDVFTGKLLISPNTTEKKLRLEYVRADKDFDAHFKLAASDYFSKHTTAPWAKTLNAELKKAGIAPLTIGTPAQLSAGITAVEKAMAEWFEPKRTQWKKKDTWVKRLEEHLKKAHRCAFFAPMLNDLRGRTEAALSKNKALFDTLKVDEDEATLSIGDQAAGVTKELRAAVRSLGIVKFLTTLGSTGSAAGISFAHFADPTHPLGFGFRDSANKLANSTYIKERFRKVSPQNHEWIPCNKILDTVQRDMDAPATDTAPEAIDEAQEWQGWVNLQDSLRTPTKDIIFTPNVPTASLAADLSTYLRSPAEDEQPAPTVAAYASSLKATRFGLSGHSGALYLPHKSGQKPQTTGQPAFHDRLRVLFDNHKDPAAYIGGLKRLVEDDLWNGVIDFLPKALRGHHHRIEMDYTGAAGGVMEPDLEAFGGRIKEENLKLIAMLENVSLPK